MIQEEVPPVIDKLTDREEAMYMKKGSHVCFPPTNPHHCQLPFWKCIRKAKISGNNIILKIKYVTLTIKLKI